MVLFGTEAFHKRCLVNASKSVLARTRHELAVAQCRIAGLEADNRRAAEDLAALHAQAMRAGRAGQHLEALLKDAREDAANAHASAQLRKETLDNLLAERNRLANELAAERAKVREMTQASEAGDKHSDGRDDTEIRFSLLELDT